MSDVANTPQGTEATPQAQPQPQQQAPAVPAPNALPADLTAMLEVLPGVQLGSVEIGGWLWPVYAWENYDQALWEMTLATSFAHTADGGNAVDNGIRLMAKIVWLILRKGAPGTTALDREQLQFSFTERQALNVLITQSRLHFDGNIVAAAQSIISACSNCPVTFVSDAAKIVAKDADVADPTSTSGRQASQGAAGGNRASRRRRKRNRKAGQTGAA